MSDRERPTCPACGARFRSAVECSRCGADLSALMALAALAYARRGYARRLLRDGDVAGALAEARAAQALAATPSGEAIMRVASCLARVTGAGSCCGTGSVEDA